MISMPNAPPPSSRGSPRWVAETYDIVVNASPAGIRPGDPLPIDVSRLNPTTFVGDVVTKPR